MLLLVLILVLVAFGLLVVALLTSSVTWAWVSVAVSVAAAGVLLLDWLQRRSAVRVGDRQVPAAPAAGTLGPEPARIPGGDAITEVIPIVRPGYPDQPDATADGATEEAVRASWRRGASSTTNGRTCRRPRFFRSFNRPALRRYRPALTLRSPHRALFGHRA